MEGLIISDGAYNRNIKGASKQAIVVLIEIRFTLIGF